MYTCTILTDWPWPIGHILHNISSRLLFIFSPGEKQVCDTGDEAIMKIYKKTKIEIPEIGVIMSKICALIWHTKKALLPVENLGMRMWLA